MHFMQLVNHIHHYIYYYFIKLHILLLYKADIHFTVSRTVEGRVDVCGWLYSEMVHPSQC